MGGTCREFQAGYLYAGFGVLVENGAGLGSAYSPVCLHQKLDDLYSIGLYQRGGIDSAGNKIPQRTC